MQGWLYLAIEMELLSKRVVGWSMQTTVTRNLVIDALSMAVRLRHPKRVVVLSDQRSQHGRDDWHRFCAHKGLVPRMSRRVSCLNDAVAESFFSALKKRWARRRARRMFEEAHSVCSIS